MKKLTTYFCFVLTFSQLFFSCSKTIEGDIIITNVNIIDVKTGKVNANMDLIVTGEEITSIIPHKNNINYHAKNVVDGSEKFLIPGLWDMHAHTSSEDNTRDILFPTFISNGITGIRVMSSDCFGPCWELEMTIEQSRKLQEEVKNKTLIGPKTILGSDYIRGPEPGKPSTIGQPGTEEHGKELVHLLIDRGVDFIKMYDELPREPYFAIASEAKKQGLPFAGHVPVAVKASEASDVGQKSIEHCCEGNLFDECNSKEEELRKKIVLAMQSGDPKDLYEIVLEMVKSYDDAKCQAIYQKFIANGTWFVPTLLAAETNQPIRLNWKTDPRLKYVPKNELKWWYDDDATTQELYGQSYPEIRIKRFEIVRDMNKAGVNLLAGSDCGVYGAFWGSGLHDELKLLVEAGLTELEALQTATINAAKYADLSDSLGIIEEGMLADLVLLDANPLNDISNTKRIVSVFSNGQYFDSSTLESIKEKVALEVSKQPDN